MGRKRRSVIWSISSDEFAALVSRSKSFKDVLEFFGLGLIGGNYKTLKARLCEDGLDYSHFGKSKSPPKFKQDLSEVLVLGSDYSRTSLKKRLIDEGILKNECKLCGLKNRWKGKPLVLILDHINGVPNDNRLGNLRLLCPNCNSQTSTFAGRNTKRVKKVKVVDPEWRSKAAFKQRKVQRPTKAELEKLLWEMPTIEIARRYSVSDNAVAKWAKQYGLSKPSRGYWAKQIAGQKGVSIAGPTWSQPPSLS